MARVIVKSQGLVLRTRRMGETSKLVTLYTVEHGKLKATAKGARRPKSKYGGALEPLTEVRIVCYLRDDRELQTLSDAEVVRVYAGVSTDMTRLAYASAGCEMVERLTIEHEPNERLYRCLAGLLGGLEEVAPEQVESLFWYFQLRAAEALGYRPELGQCLSCGADMGQVAWARFDPVAGGGLCPDCATRAAEAEVHGPVAQGTRRLAGESARFLATLQRIRAYSRDSMPAAPEGRGEIRSLLRGFYECHAGHSGRLKALDFLESVGRS